MSLAGAGAISARYEVSHIGIERDEAQSALWRQPSVVDQAPAHLRAFSVSYGPAVSAIVPGVRTVAPTHAVGGGDVFSDQDINGIVAGPAWTSSAAHLTLTFSFPTAVSNYGAGYDDQEALASFHPLSAADQDVVRYAFSLISSYTGINFKEIAETNNVHATLRYAGSEHPPTSYGYYPSTDATGGDTFFGNIRDDMPTKAGYAFDTIMHEIGHNMGLKHGQQADSTYGVLPEGHNSTEWSTMTYYSYVGTPDDFYSNAEGGGNQTYMMDDIAALQYMYGANFSTNAGDTVYKWSISTGEMFINGVGQTASSTNTIFETIWDGGGKDTYDLSNYLTDLNVTLQPGEWSTFSSAQLADLDGYTDLNTHYAHGNIANAHAFNGITESLIENVFGGRGSDVIEGNNQANDLVGNGGKDRLSGLEGSDTLDGGVKKDLLAGGSGADSLDGGKANDVLLGGAGGDVLTGGGGADIFRFTAVWDSTPDLTDRITDLTNADVIDLSVIDANGSLKGNGAFVQVDAFTHEAAQMTVIYDRHDKVTVVSGDTDGDGEANFVLLINGNHQDFAGFQP